ncbi:SDR family oxidoreductase, partial [Yersinia enterocolitica]
MKTLLLTGATGFLGGAVLEKLLLENSDFNY